MIAMGGISDVGMLTRDSHSRRALRSRGVILFSSSSALAGLDYQIRNNIIEMVFCFLYKIFVSNYFL